MQVDKKTRSVTASASFYRPLEKLEIVSNGLVIAAVPGDGARMKLTASTRVDNPESFWVAARTVAQKNPGEPDIQAHTNPVYLLTGGKPVMVRAARESLVRQWEDQLAWFKSAGLEFRDDSRRREFFERAERTLAELRRTP
jgi:hypothetical protein